MPSAGTHQLLQRLLEHEEWYIAAACSGENPEWWYAEKLNDPNIPKAKAICADCAVQELCLETALARRERHGIWGGLTVAERKKLEARRRRRTTLTKDEGGLLGDQAG